MDLKEITRSMSNVTPNKKQIDRIEKLRECYKKCLIGLDKYGTNSTHLEEAAKQLQDSLMWAVKSIVLEKEKPRYV
jgi:hypothetical protein